MSHFYIFLFLLCKILAHNKLFSGMANVVFKYVTMTGQPLKEGDIQQIVG
jgi:hypothetical protein